jgi:hypothetical protein
MQGKIYYLIADRSVVLCQGDLGKCEQFLKENRSTFSQYTSLAIYNHQEASELGISI